MTADLDPLQPTLFPNPPVFCWVCVRVVGARPVGCGSWCVGDEGGAA